ncbi:MAG: hypothetical protein ABJP89_05710 [Lentilitoribacter sp.]
MAITLDATVPLPATANNLSDFNLPNSGLTLPRGVDPLSNIITGKPVVGCKDNSLEHQGRTYSFSSQANLTTLKSNQKAYLPVCGSDSSYGTAFKTKWMVPPTSDTLLMANCTS